MSAYDPKRTFGKRGAAGNLTQLEESVSAAASPSPPVNQIEGTVLCIPGLGLLDETVAMPFAQLLRREGIPAEAKETETLSISKLFSWKRKTSSSSVSATWNTRHQRNYTTRRVVCAERQPVCQLWSAYSTKQGKPTMAIRNSFRERGVPARLFV
ncbi:MAG: hypothetical protein WCD78_02600 [Pseudolabrys sp.]